MNTDRRDAGDAPRSLYVHYPFCVHRCHYCDFAVTRTSDPPLSEWLSALGADLDRWFDGSGWRMPAALDTIFVGGGTPSLLGDKGMDRLAESEIDVYVPIT